MANWVGVVTNAGNNLLTEWVNGQILTFDGAAAGTGTVPAEKLLGQTELVGQKQTIQIIGSERIPTGIRLKLRITAPPTGYTLNQFGIWAKLGGAATMIALFQHDQGIPIPAASEAPDFVYTFFAVVSCSNIGKWTINVDPSALVTMTDLEKKLDRAGGAMTGDLEMGNHSISGVNHMQAEAISAKRGGFNEGVGLVGLLTFSEENADPLFAVSGQKNNPGGFITVKFETARPDIGLVLSGLSAPMAENEAANKGYVDAQIRLLKEQFQKMTKS